MSYSVNTPSSKYGGETQQEEKNKKHGKLEKIPDKLKYARS